MREAKAAFQAMPEAFRDRLNGATELTVREIVRGAQNNIARSPSIDTRSLYNAVGWSMNYKNGRGRAGIMNVQTTISNPTMGGVGKSTIKVRGILILGKGGSAATRHGARLVNPRRTAHLIEFGRRGAKAEPFMRPAAAAQTQAYLDRCVAAGRLAEQDLARIASQSGGAAPTSNTVLAPSGVGSVGNV